MKKIFLGAFAALFCCAASAQNVQLHYDFAQTLYPSALATRPLVTLTYENFKADDWGSTFYFVDLDFAGAANNCQGAYTEIYRELCFWKDSKLDWLSLHLEFNGGLNTATSFDNAYLAGLTYSGHSADYSKTWSLSAMYKFIPGNSEKHNFQLTGVWGINFASGWCTFSGFVDFWREYRPWQGTRFIAISEPQLWVNLNRLAGMEGVNLSVGGECEISYNFVAPGFFAIPTLAAKWTF